NEDKWLTRRRGQISLYVRVERAITQHGKLNDAVHGVIEDTGCARGQQGEGASGIGGNSASVLRTSIVCSCSATRRHGDQAATPQLGLGGARDPSAADGARRPE